MATPSAIPNMALYYEAAEIVERVHRAAGSVKAHIFKSDAELKSNPKQVYALISQASKWSAVLSEVIERASLLFNERKLNPSLAVVLVHDLLLSRNGVAAPAAHPLRVAVEKHRARLRAELSRIRVAQSFASFRALQTHVESLANQFGPGDWPHPRWVRVSRSANGGDVMTLENELTSKLGYLKEYQVVGSLQEVMEACKDPLHPPRLLYVDPHVPGLVAVPSLVEILASRGYSNGSFIIQDKASCFPALLLDPKDGGGDILDACAAPGNKTTHLAALLREWGVSGRIWACERDKQRTRTLRSMVAKAGVENLVSILATQDFLKLEPSHYPARDIRAILIDPSCSGSGILARDEKFNFVLPKVEKDESQLTALGKRKRSAPTRSGRGARTLDTDETDDALTENLAENAPTSDLTMRLENLSEIQVKMLVHGMSFPKARKIIYSTCSIYAEENEAVVMRALTSPIAQGRGWRILKREEQVASLRRWPHRGSEEAFSGRFASGMHAAACIRCLKNTEDGTQGFFVAGFVRDSTEDANGSTGLVPQADNIIFLEDDDSDETWEGFDD